MEHNRIHDAETAVLGSIFITPELIDDCYLQPEEFVDERHQMIMSYFRFLAEEQIPIDPVSMVQQSGNNITEIGGVSYLWQLRQSVPTTSNFDYYQKFIRADYIRRKTADVTREMSMTAANGEGDVKEHIARCQERLEELAELATKNQNQGLKRMSSTLDGHVNLLNERKSSKGMTGAKTLSKDVDRLTGGHQKGDLEVIAARPSMGKTAYMISDAIRTTQGGAAAAIFSAEMLELQITERAICALANLDNAKMRSGMFDDKDWERYSYARTILDSLPIFIDDTTGMTIQHIRKEVKRLVKTQPNLVVYVDYIQIIGGGRKFNSRQEEVSYVSRQLKQIAREFGVTVLALSQLSRDVEKRVDKHPMMSDLGESGAIERDADIITFLYRDEYYNKESERKGIVELIIAKGRNVGTGRVDMAFLKNTGKFADIETEHKKAG
ncbi:replicative DNA helicase [Paenibacillus pinihumi]|uniref:replicative DNA helicase n=1 Tax=Paenibacillus pinihumi TaxID=669462 RepID=UPI000406607B|nr:replicative DNA helicase [Paenibacillus pinihumi]